MDSTRTLRHYLENTAPPVVVDRLENIRNHQPAVIMPAPGDAPLSTDPRFPGNGMPLRVQDRETLDSGWPRLVRGGQALGKSENFRYDADTTDIQKGISVAWIEGSDLDACQIRVTLTQPAIAMVTLSDIDDNAALMGAQDVQGFASNDQIDPDQDFPGTGAPPSWAPITAAIRWGTGGVQHEAFVDWIQGATVTISASFVSITPVAMPDAINRPGQSALYKCGACLAPGYGAASGARRTVFTESVDDQESTVAYPVPPFAKRVTVLGYSEADPAIASGYIRFWQRSTPAGNLGSPFFNTNQPTSFDIPNGATYFTVVNGSGAEMGFSVIFELDI